MSSHSEDKDKEENEDDSIKKKYVKIWRIEASKEFLLLMFVLVFAIGTSMYNPIEIRKLSEQLIDLGIQNNQTNLQNLNNTDKIINYLDISNKNDTAKGIDIIKVLFLYMQDAQRDAAKIMEHFNITNTHFVRVNATHVITENGTLKLPYPIDLSGFVPIKNDNISRELEAIKN